MTRLAIIFSLLLVTPAWAESNKITNEVCIYEQPDTEFSETRYHHFIRKLKNGECDVIQVFDRKQDRGYRVASYCDFNKTIIRLDENQYQCVPVINK